MMCGYVWMIFPLDSPLLSLLQVPLLFLRVRIRSQILFDERNPGAIGLPQPNENNSNVVEPAAKYCCKFKHFFRRGGDWHPHRFPSMPSLLLADLSLPLPVNAPLPLPLPQTNTKGTRPLPASRPTNVQC
jgi:hypothetical protein